MAFHNYKPFTLSVYIAASDAMCLMHELNGALLALEFGQVWARFIIEQCAKCHTTLDSIVGPGKGIACEIA